MATNFGLHANWNALTPQEQTELKAMMEDAEEVIGRLLTTFKGVAERGEDNCDADIVACEITV